MTRTRVTTVAMLVLAFSAAFLRVANAYVDPGSGSFVFQALVGGLLAATVTLRVLWKRLISVLFRKGPADRT